MVKPTNKYTARSKNTLNKSLCKKEFAKLMLTSHRTHVWNKSIVPNNNLLEAVTTNIFKI